MKTPENKDEVFKSIFEAIIRLDMQKGHLKWKISEVARASKISRTLIYYYFGNSKENMIATAIDFLGEEYFGLSPERLAMWERGEVLESVLKSRELCQGALYVPFFHMARRHLKGKTGDKLRDLEARYHKKLQSYYPEANKDDIEALAAVLFGMAAMPNLSNAGVVSALGIIQRNLVFKRAL